MDAAGLMGLGTAGWGRGGGAEGRKRRWVDGGEGEGEYEGVRGSTRVMCFG